MVCKRPLDQKYYFIMRHFYKFSGYLFDKRHNLDFSGFIPCNTMSIESSSSVIHATAYQAWGIYNFIILVRSALILRPIPKYFIDIGCGKGRQCIYARKIFNFKNIIGIDFSEDLIKVCKSNQKNCAYKDIDFELADASTWVLPNEYCIVFLYNPFDEIILNKFILANIGNFKEHGSIICYANDIHRDVLRYFGFEIIYRDTEHNSVSIFSPLN